MGYFDALHKLLGKNDTRENQKPIKASSLASYDPTFQKPSAPKIPDLRLNDFGLASIGGEPVQLEQNPLNPPNMVMPTPPGLDALGTPSIAPENDGGRKTGSLAANLLKGLALAGIAGAVGGPVGVQATSAVVSLIDKIKSQKAKQKNEQIKAEAKAKAEQRRADLEERRVLNEEKRVKDWKESSDKTHSEKAAKQNWEGIKDMAAGIRDTILGKPGTQKIYTQEESDKIKAQAGAARALEKQRLAKIGGSSSAKTSKVAKESAASATLSDGTKISFGQYKLMPVEERQKIKDLFENPNQAVNWDVALSGKSQKKDATQSKDKEIEKINKEIERVNIEKEVAPRVMAAQGMPVETIQAKQAELEAKKEGLEAAKAKKTDLPPKKRTFETIMKTFEAFKKEAQ